MLNLNYRITKQNRELKMLCYKYDSNYVQNLYDTYIHVWVLNGRFPEKSGTESVKPEPDLR